MNIIKKIDWLVRQIKCIKISIDEAEVFQYTFSPIAATNIVQLLENGVAVSEIDLTQYLDDTNAARLVNGVLDATTKIATFEREDNTFFTVDFSSLVDIQPTKTSDLSNDGSDGVNPFITKEDVSINFADEDGEIKYGADVDKRTGTYDLTNKVYYPEVNKKTLVNTFNDSVSDDAVTILNPIDSFGRSRGAAYTGGGKTHYLLQFPAPIVDEFSFDLEIYFAYGGDSDLNQAFDTRAKASFAISEMNTLDNSWGDIDIFVAQSTDPEVIANLSLGDPELVFNFGTNANGDFIVGFEYKDAEGVLPTDYSLTNLKLSTGSAQNDPIDFVKGWKQGQAWTYYAQGNIKNDFIITKSIGSADYFTIDGVDDNTTDLKIYDSLGALQDTTDEIHIGEGLEYNPATKTIVSSYGGFYDKGTFTPYMSNYGGGESYSQTLGWARYVRIGDLVTFSIRITSIVISSAPSDGIAIHGMPFAPYLLDTVTDIMVSGSSVDSSNLFGYVTGTRVRLYAVPAGGVVSTTSAYFKPTFTSGLIDITGSYLVNSVAL